MTQVITGGQPASDDMGLTALFMSEKERLSRRRAVHVGEGEIVEALRCSRRRMKDC
jgi:hypothetical protein